jgi:hypothetical protein
MSINHPKNSTNVRFIIPALAAMGAVGCAAHGPAEPTAAICGASALAVCNRYGPDQSCECVERRAMREPFDRLGVPTAFGSVEGPSGD